MAKFLLQEECISCGQCWSTPGSLQQKWTIRKSKKISELTVDGNKAVGMLSNWLKGPKGADSCPIQIITVNKRKANMVENQYLPNTGICFLPEAAAGECRRVDVGERKCTEIRREEIVRAALSLVEQNGLDILNINDIATKIGLVPASIYRHFKGKDEIIKALIEFADSSLQDNLSRAKACSGTAIDKLEMLFRLHVKLLREEAAIPRILFFLMSSNRNR
jgi:ferredoxin